MRHLCVLAALMVLALTSGCASWHVMEYPVRKDGKGGLADLAENSPFFAENAEHALKVVQGMREFLTTRANKRRKAQYYGSEVVFYSTLVAAGGIVDSRDSVRDGGGLLAALASIITGRYQLAGQRAALLKARDRVVCIEGALLETGAADNSFKAHQSNIAAILPTAAKDVNDVVIRAHGTIPRLTREALTNVAAALERDLDALQPVGMTRSELVAVLNQARAAEESAKNAPTVKALEGLGDPEADAMHAQSVASLAYEERLDACTAL